MAAKPNFHLDAHFPNSKEMLTIERRYRLAATGAFSAAGCWSCDKLTDGWVPVRALVELLVTPFLTDLLMSSTLWIPAVDVARGSVTWATRGGPVTAVQFDNWERWQQTKAKWLKGNRSNADRQARLRERRSKEVDELKSRLDNALLELDYHANGDTLENSGNALPPPAGEERRGEEVVKSVGKGDVSSATGSPPLEEFPDHCTKHRHDPEPPKCHDCRRRRESNQRTADLAALTAANDQQRRRQRITDCILCDPAGWVLDMWGEHPIEPLVKCQHPDTP